MNNNVKRPLLSSCLMMRRVSIALILIVSTACWQADGFVENIMLPRCKRPSKHECSIMEQEAQLPILYESDHLLVIQKPEGISHHDDGTKDSGIVSLVRKQQANGLIDYQGRVYGVHRLDKVTSGILLFAKDAETAKAVSGKFRDGEITKYYMGLSARKPVKKKQGWIKGNMIKGRRKSWMLTREGNDNYASTRFFTSGVGALFDHKVQHENTCIPPKTLILFRPYTGRTHQLRVAAKSIGLPLLGDQIYRDGNAKTNDDRGDIETAADVENAALISRTYLHACAMHLDLNGDPVTLWSPPPFQSIWDPNGVAEFQRIYHDLMNKHCECGAIKMLMNGEPLK